LCAARARLPRQAHATRLGLRLQSRGRWTLVEPRSRRGGGSRKIDLLPGPRAAGQLVHPFDSVQVPAMDARVRALVVVPEIGLTVRRHELDRKRVARHARRTWRKAT